MVYCEGDYSTAAMYNGTNYAVTCSSSIYNASPTLSASTLGCYVPPPTATPTYQPQATAPERTAYTDPNGYRMYWPPTAKEELGVYNQGTCWAPVAQELYIDNSCYKGDYYANPHALPVQQPVGQQYASSCALMPPQQMLPPSAMEAEMMKDSQYCGWIGAPSTNNCKTRTKDKYRVVYTDHQRLELEKEFHYSRYITIRRKAELAVSLNLSERQVKIWFQNRRAKERKVNKKKGVNDDKTPSEDPRDSPASSAEEDSSQHQDITSQALTSALHL